MERREKRRRTQRLCQQWHSLLQLQLPPHHLPVPPACLSVYLGCYFDDGNRALRETYSTDSSMTPQVCNSICQGFPFYAVEYSSQCFCGTTFHNGYPKVPDSECNYPCSGDSGVECGGFWRLSLYSLTGASAPPAVNYTAQGCFIDKTPSWAYQRREDRWHDDTAAMRRVLRGVPVCRD